MRKMIRGQQTRQISTMPVQPSTPLPLYYKLKASFYCSVLRGLYSDLACSTLPIGWSRHYGILVFLCSGLFENRVGVMSTLRFSSCYCCTRLSLCNNSSMLEVFGTGVADFSLWHRLHFRYYRCFKNDIFGSVGGGSVILPEGGLLLNAGNVLFSLFREIGSLN
jgi:hypothetical protein